MTKLVTATLAALALLLVGTATANAHDGHHAAEPWQLIDTLDGGDIRDTAQDSAIVDATTLDLVWSDDRTAGHGGTSAETANLGIKVKAGDVLSVNYQLLDGADPAGGAVRAFVYSVAGANTLTDGPQAFTAAPASEDSGTLEIVLPDDGTIGTAGLVYDTSNSAGGGVSGTVRFSGLAVNGEPVSFLPAPAGGDPDGEEGQGEDPANEEDAGSEETETGSEEEAGEDADSEESAPAAVPTAVPAGLELPQTGANPAVLAVVAFGLVAFGAWLITRRRSPQSQ